MGFISVFDLFKIGIGPSSSHTLGPMRAALHFRRRLLEAPRLRDLRRIQVRLFGSLAHTGRGHHTDRAVLWGLAGIQPQAFEPERAGAVLREARYDNALGLGSPFGRLRFRPEADLIFDTERPVGPHPNELLLTACDGEGRPILEETWFSVGGGFIARPEDLEADAQPSARTAPPHPFRTARELLARSRQTGLSIAELVLENELSLRAQPEIDEGLQRLWSVMTACISRGLETQGVLPGGLSVKRRAPALAVKLRGVNSTSSKHRPAAPHDWVHAWAMAINEENAAGGQVVTSPTNGAAGVVPAVLQYFLEFENPKQQPLSEVLQTYFLTASAIGSLFKLNASISGAEVGCQGEVGTAASMAAAGLAALWGAHCLEVEHAAEIALEHHLGLTCDPVGGLVQVPCIERNGFGATKAISAARLALYEDGEHRVSLDDAIETMRQTGADMSSKYKETSLGGLAVNVVEC